MNRPKGISGRYEAALRGYLQTGRPALLKTASGLGDQAAAAGLKVLDMAKIHERALIDRILPAHPSQRRARIVALAGMFFTAAMSPLGSSAGKARVMIARLRRSVEALSRRTVDLAAANLALSLEITQRKAVEATLKQSERRYAQLLKQSDRLQGQLRHMSRQILSAQEEERRNISRELHDVIAQTLTGINVRLAALKKAAVVDADGLDRNILLTQRMVIKAVGIVHRFARELRPAVLDDLGLIPALDAYIKPLAARSGLRVRLSAYKGVEELGMVERTVLFRVAQETLTNVVRHAHAGQVEVELRRTEGGMRMRIHDDGRAFPVERVLLARGGKRLGLLGMRERLEMVGGSFVVESAKGKGTTITASIPRHGPAGPQRAKARAAGGKAGA